MTSKPLNTNKKLFLECSLCRDQSEARLNHKKKNTKLITVAACGSFIYNLIGFLSQYNKTPEIPVFTVFLVLLKGWVWLHFWCEFGNYNAFNYKITLIRPITPRFLELKHISFRFAIAIFQSFTVAYLESTFSNKVQINTPYLKRQ